MIDLTQAMKDRHSVRSYISRPIDEDKVTALQNKIQKINAESGLHFQLMINEPKAFSGRLAHYGSFYNCANYFAVTAKDGMEVEIGYHGEQLVLLSQQLGLNTCWVALTYSKSKVPVDCATGEKLRIVIALGYGETQGVPHKSKKLMSLCRVNGAMPDWFRRGMEAAMLAPTAVNQQKFRFELVDQNTVKADTAFGPYAKIDLGIAKLHFEIGAGKDNFQWA